eukprot:6464142-Amphidinium_carterae.1
MTGRSLQDFRELCLGVLGKVPAEWEKAMWYQRFLRMYIVKGSDGKFGLPPTDTADLAGMYIKEDGTVELPNAVVIQRALKKGWIRDLSRYGELCKHTQEKAVLDQIDRFVEDHFTAFGWPIDPQLPHELAMDTAQVYPDQPGQVALSNLLSVGWGNDMKRKRLKKKQRETHPYALYLNLLRNCNAHDVQLLKTGKYNEFLDTCAPPNC